jgi:hypothetical protein
MFETKISVISPYAGSQIESKLYSVKRHEGSPEKEKRSARFPLGLDERLFEDSPWKVEMADIFIRASNVRVCGLSEKRSAVGLLTSEVDQTQPERR